MKIQKMLSKQNLMSIALTIAISPLCSNTALAFTGSAQLIKLVQQGQQQYTQLKKQYDELKYVADTLIDTLNSIEKIQGEYEYYTEFDLERAIFEFNQDYLDVKLLYDIDKINHAGSRLEKIITQLKPKNFQKSEDKKALAEISVEVKGLVNRLAVASKVSDSFDQASKTKSQKLKEYEKISAASNAYLAKEASRKETQEINERIAEVEKINKLIAADKQILSMFNHRK